MLLLQFRATARAAAWLLLGLVALDLGNPSLCALDQGQLAPASANADSRPSDDGNTVPPVHVDDCFCCSHCVDVGFVSRLAPLAFIDRAMAQPIYAPLFPAGHPPYHPPRV